LPFEQRDPTPNATTPGEDQVQVPTLDQELTGVYARMSGLLLADETVETVLRMLTALTLDIVPGACGAGVSLIGSDGHRTTSAATSGVVEEADALQYELGEGPCLAAWMSRSLQRIHDTMTERRWPRWVGAVHQLRLRAVLSAPLVAGDTCPGAIKVYGRFPGTFDDEDARRLSQLAAPAAALVVNVQAHQDARRLSDGLKDALRGRDVISMAKGMLMSDRGVDEAGAFALLVSTAERERKATVEVARDIVMSAAHRRR
jgi:transcriptional regulator with GAF, ATPase, and Fis domain